MIEAYKVNLLVSFIYLIFIRMLFIHTIWDRQSETKKKRKQNLFFMISHSITFGDPSKIDDGVAW